MGYISITFKIGNSSCRQKISKDIGSLHNTIRKLNLMNIYRILYLKIAEYKHLQDKQNI